MRNNQLKKYFFIVAIGLLGFFIIHTVVITIDGLNDELEKVDVAVVLGNKVELDGQPSERLAARLDKAIGLYKEGYFEQIIVSGGIGQEGFDEAEVMKEYLIEKGIPEQYITTDLSGYNTAMTAKNTKVIIGNQGYQSAMIITQFFHISRTKLAFHQAGIKHVYSAHAEYFELRDLYSTVREFPAYYKYLFD
ncbi:YdcF family protein [Tenuibacillus multivorans]|uniref:Protein SanA, affects membrane permeability for vancomycin n=1 Tax=Tenuibacillus multivorans TaxID=237069 RepID=A0A1H0B3U3_9BACI|nr:YdcF family protein [Tenuibacillus multivorans]GEL77541.1 hypothetical protein TMU01_17760 [Tenuibacillus multivorans]SDN40310.1 protein SanA, affects membrane permeability for vancomycin [Tenuibacillus multivorans]